MKATSRHSIFTIDGFLARCFIVALRVTPQPTDLVIAACFGVVELLGAKRLGKLFYAALRKQLKEQIHAPINKASGARVSAPNRPKL